MPLLYINQLICIFNGSTVIFIHHYYGICALMSVFDVFAMSIDYPTYTMKSISFLMCGTMS